MSVNFLLWHQISQQCWARHMAARVTNPLLLDMLLPISFLHSDIAGALCMSLTIPWKPVFRNGILG